MTIALVLAALLTPFLLLYATMRLAGFTHRDMLAAVRGSR